MNKKEYYNNSTAHKTFERKYVQELLRQWKIDNNYTCKCVVHHRNDTEECVAYNEAHYELWGFNLDGTFEYGKYVVFMTHAEHSSHHNSGDKNSMRRPEVRAKVSAAKKGRESTFKGKHHTEESKQKLRESHLGKRASDETRKKLSEMRQGEQHWNYGKHWSDETKHKMSQSHTGFKHTEESKQKMSDSRKGEKNSFYGKQHSEETLQHLREICSQQMKNDALHYHQYKANGGDLPWHTFRKLFHNNDPQIIQYLNK